MKRSDFIQYLRQTPRLCDGNLSQAPASLVDSNAKGTIADLFKGNQPPDAGAVREGRDKPLYIFFNPKIIMINNMQQNEAMLFHEGLHGYTRLADGLPPSLGHAGLCQMLKIDVEFPNCW